MITSDSSAQRSGDHLSNIRRRFTDTAGAFSDFVLSRRADEAERLSAAIADSLQDAPHAAALDLACGPGTFLRALAPRVGKAAGLDITPAMLSRARDEAARAGLANTVFFCADVNALPFADASWDVALCSYALHHLLRPDHVVGEMARVVRRGGRVAIVDMVVPEGADSAANNQIERARDPSHARTLTASELRRLFQGAGLREFSSELLERRREFDDWMRVGGHEPGSAAHNEARRLMEASLPHDTCGFAPSFHPSTGALHFTQHSLFLLAERE